jgi:hypothetical protein
MQILTVQHAQGNPTSFAPVQNIQFNAAEGQKSVWLRIGLADGNEVVMTANHCVVPNGKHDGAVRAQDLIPGIDSLMVMATRPTLVQTISQLAADEMPSSNVWLEVAGCEKTGAEGGCSVLVCGPSATAGGAFVAVGDAQLTPAPVNLDSMPKTNSSFNDDASEARSILRSGAGMSNGSGERGGHVSFQNSSEARLPEPWKLPTPTVAIPMQKSWGTSANPGVALDERHQLQVKNTFFDVISQHGSGSGSEKSNKEHKVMSWTDERAGLTYGSYPQVKPLTHRKAPSARSNSLSGLSGPTSSISSHTGSRLSDFSSEGDGSNGHVVVLGGAAAGKPLGEVHMSEFQQVPRHPTTGEITSLGSVGHFNGTCRPCEWMQRGRPCKYGWRCTYCHIVDEHARYSRKNRQQNPVSKPQISSSFSSGGGSLATCGTCKMAL